MAKKAKNRFISQDGFYYTAPDEVTVLDTRGAVFKLDKEAAVLFLYSIGQSDGQAFENFKKKFPSAEASFGEAKEKLKFFEDNNFYCSDFKENHFNIEKVADNIMKAEKYPSALALAYVHVRLTSACPFKCKGCYVRAGTAKENELKTAEVKKIIDSAAALGCAMITFSGGEPALIPDEVAELSRYAKQKGIAKVDITTTGYKLNEIADKWKEAGVDILRFSLDGMAEYHNWYRGRSDAFEIAVKGIKLSKEKGFKTSATCVLTNKNAGHLEQLAKYADENSIKLHLSPLVKTGRGEESGLELTADELMKIAELAEALKKKYPKAELTTSCEIQKEEFNGPMCCLAGIGAVFITETGAVQVCPHLPEYIIGNVRENSLDELLMNEKNSHFTQIKDVNKKCAKCKKRAVCVSSCKARAYKMFGDFFLEKEPKNCPADK
ncbi:MAG: radical SAM protein [Candidatus Micrarchaeota archaeon]